MSEDLRECPFCGGWEDTYIIPDGHEGWYLGCEQCNYNLYLPNCTEEEAARRWNDRPVENTLIAEITRYRRALYNLEGDCICRQKFATSDEEKLFLAETLSHVGSELDIDKRIRE